jgi:hypothetical protein
VFTAPRFSSGVAALTSITAAEFVPLCWQMIAVLGVNEEEELKGGSILPLGWKRKVVKVFYNLITIREELWKKQHSESELEALQERIKE